MKKFKFILVAVMSMFLLFSFLSCSETGSGENGKGGQPQISHTFSVNKSNITLEVGETFEIVAAYGKETLTYTVDKADVASVSSTGFVTALKEGVAYVTIAAGGEVRTCKITVIAYEYTVELESANIIMTVGTQKKLSATLFRNGEVYDGLVSWTTTGGTLTFDGNNAVFTSTEKGTYTITVTSDKGATTSCVVTVIESISDLG